MTSHAALALNSVVEGLFASHERPHGAFGDDVTVMRPADTAESVARDIANAASATDIEHPFLVCDLGRVFRSHLVWLKNLPRVRPFYAVKCCPDDHLLALLARLGCGFDCASKGEIAQVLAHDVSPANIVYANPCKATTMLRYAREEGVGLMTFDNEDELYKVQKVYPDARLVLRIAVSDPTAVCPLNLKYGAEPVDQAVSLLKLAALLDLNVVGVSFHIGSGCNDPTAYAVGIAHGRRLFDLGRREGHDMRILDLGGGFPGCQGYSSVSFEQIARVINSALDLHFPSADDVQLIAEPGRYYACEAFTLVTNVIAKTSVSAARVTQNVADIDRSAYMYYINDGVYGSLNCIIYDHYLPDCKVVRVKQNWMNRQPDDDLMWSSVWGPTCDSLDCVYAKRRLPEMNIGDWLLFPDMGAYSVAAGSTFNGFDRPSVYYFFGGVEWSVWQRVVVEGRNRSRWHAQFAAQRRPFVKRHRRFATLNWETDGEHVMHSSSGSEEETAPQSKSSTCYLHMLPYGRRRLPSFTLNDSGVSSAGE